MNNKIDIVEVLADPSVSYWLKSAINILLERDVVDAYKDSYLLARIFRQRCDEVLEKAKSKPDVLPSPKGWKFAQ
jgi:hypothetical protein